MFLIGSAVKISGGIEYVVGTLREIKKQQGAYPNRKICLIFAV